jgi:hypothetical protein
MHLSDSCLYETVILLEGKRWAISDGLGSKYSLKKLLELREYFLTQSVGSEFSTEMAQALDHSGVVYGEGGVARYVLRGDELVLDGNSTHEAKRTKAEKLGIRVLR